MRGDPSTGQKPEIPDSNRARVYYDGDCGLCHFAVKFLVAHDRDGSRFRYAPLDGATFRERLGADERLDLPDSIVVETPDGRLLLRSTAALFALRRLGGGWAVLARLLAIVPRPLRDLGYRIVAATRRRLFAPPVDSCPVLPPDLRERFDP